MNLLPSSEADDEKFSVDQPLEVTLFCKLCSTTQITLPQFSITDVWSVPYVGTVVNGIVNSGRVKTGDPVLFGPDSNGNYQTTVVKSMQRKRFVLSGFVLKKSRKLHCSMLTRCMSSRADVATAEAGQCVSLALKRVRRATVRKGMVLVHKMEAPPRGNFVIPMLMECLLTVLAVRQFEGQVLIL